MKSKSDKRPVSRSVFWIASLMFFLSGSTGLAYQVIWFKRFGHVWGSSSLAFAAVGGSFLFGLGLGAYFFGRVADRLERPLAWYGLCELAIGIAALVIPLAIELLISLTAGLYAYLPAEPLARYLLQFAVTLVVIGPPCMLMGGTLPLLIRELTAREGALDQATGWLYAVNTFGAAAGCYLTGFLLLPMIGLLQANYLAAAVNIAIGAAALLLSRRGAARKKGYVAAAPIEPSPSWSPRLAGLYLAVTLSGLGALMLEITWSRQLALVLGGSTYSYSATLFVVLIGIAAGSLLFHLVLRPWALNPWLPLATIGALAVACSISRTALPWLSWCVGSFRETRATFAGNAGICVAAGAAVELIPALAMGILFPLFVDLTRAHASRVGRTVGDVYAWNTFGSIIGATFTGIVLFPRIGTAGALALAVALYLVALVLVLPMNVRADRLRAGISLVVGAIIIAGMLFPQDPIYTNSGRYMYDYPPGSYNDIEVKYFAEGASSNVLLTKHSDQVLSLRVNGKTDASTNEVDMAMQLGAAYIPRFIRPNAREILVIGFGSGTTSGTSLLFPETRVTCCEIEPAVFGAASNFNEVNHRPQEHTRQFLEHRNAELPPAERLSEEEIAKAANFTIHFGDGRTLLQQDDRKYDLIISEPSNPWIAGVSNLFTQEFFETAKAHLEPGGVLAQWIQTYSLTFDDYQMIVHTMNSVFPDYYGLIVLSGSDTILLASNAPLEPDIGQVEKLQSFVNDTPEIQDDLQHWFDTKDLKQLLLSRFTIGPGRLNKWAKEQSDSPLNTDLNMRLEFAAPLDLFRPKEDVLNQINVGLDPEWMLRMGAVLGISPESAQFQLAIAMAQAIRTNYLQALQYLRKVNELSPNLPEAMQLTTGVYSQLSRIYSQQHKQTELIATLQDWIKAQPGNVSARIALFDIYFDAGKLQAAADTLRPLVGIASDSAAFHANIAMRLTKLNRSVEVFEAAEKALALNPTFAADPTCAIWVNHYAWLLATHPDPTKRNGPEAVRLAKQMCEALNDKEWAPLDTLAVAYAEVGDFDQAVKLTERVQKIGETSNLPRAVEVAKSRLELFNEHKPYHEDPLTLQPVP